MQLHHPGAKVLSAQSDFGIGHPLELARMLLGQRVVGTLPQAPGIRALLDGRFEDLDDGAGVRIQRRQQGLVDEPPVPVDWRAAFPLAPGDGEGVRRSWRGRHPQRLDDSIGVDGSWSHGSSGDGDAAAEAMREGRLRWGWEVVVVVVVVEGEDVVEVVDVVVDVEVVVVVVAE